MAGKPFLTKIEEEMKRLILTMRSGADYNYSWTTVNELDMSRSFFPSALIYLEAETSLDDRSGTWSQAYFNEVTFRIEIRAQLDKEYINPIFEINSSFNKCLDDLKMLFGTNWNLSGNCDTIMYVGSERVEEKNGDIFIPGKLITNWLVRYETDRLNPTTSVQ